ncbi:hypothetical protein Tco_1144986 [Tanacetum coccineum]
MDITKAEQIALDDALVAPANRLKIGKCNLRLSSDLTSKEVTLQVVYNVLKLTPFYKEFQASADVPEIYMQEFWAIASFHNRSIRFKMNNKKHIVNLEYFREMLQNIRVNSFTMKMEILLEPTSNKLMVEHAEFDESNANVLERFYTLAGNPVKEILLKLNLPDHRILKDGGEGTDKSKITRKQSKARTRETEELNRSQRYEKRIAIEKEAAELEAKRKSQECLNIEEKSIPQASIRSRKSRIDPTLSNFTVSTKHPVPIPSESADLSNDESECDVPINDDSPESHFSTFDNPLFDSNDDFSSDDESLSEEEIQKDEFKYFSNPLYDLDDEIITNEKILPNQKDLDVVIPIPPGIDERCFNADRIHSKSLLIVTTDRFYKDRFYF